MSNLTASKKCIKSGKWLVTIHEDDEICQELTVIKEGKSWKVDAGGFTLESSTLQNVIEDLVSLYETVDQKTNSAIAEKDIPKEDVFPSKLTEENEETKNITTLKVAETKDNTISTGYNSEESLITSIYVRKDPKFNASVADKILYLQRLESSNETKINSLSRLISAYVIQEMPYDTNPIFSALLSLGISRIDFNYLAAEILDLDYELTVIESMSESEAVNKVIFDNPGIIYVISKWIIEKGTDENFNDNIKKRIITNLPLYLESAFPKNIKVDSLYFDILQACIKRVNPAEINVT